MSSQFCGPVEFCKDFYEEECPVCQSTLRNECIFEQLGSDDPACCIGYQLGRRLSAMDSKNLIEVRKKELSELDARIGKNLCRIRKRKDISQAELSRRFGTTPGRISDIEAGKRRVSLTFIESISTLLDCDPLELMLPYRETCEGIRMENKP
jgi:DNA-binding Xre family transcriptional regulator